MLKLLFSVVGLLCVVGAAAGDDWPQWMGPGRDNVWRESGVIEEFPEGGPEVLWRAPVAGGYAGVAVAGGRVYVADYVTEENVKVDNFSRDEFTGTERVLCLDEATGQELWSHTYPVNYSVSYPAGPRCTPIVHGDWVYTLGTEGHLFCFDAASGEVIWEKHLPTEYGAKTPLWGYAAHPLIDGEKLITLAGGPGAHAVALDLATGDEIWRTMEAEETGYSPPSIIEAGGVRQLILMHPAGIAGANPDTGEVYWTQEYEATNGSIIMTPVRSGPYLFAGGYSKKNILLELAADSPSATTVWRDANRKGLTPINVQPFVEGEVMYGVDDNGMLYCVEIASGDRLWETGQPLSSERPVGSGTAFLVKNGDRFWLFNELGELIIAKLSKEGYEEIDRAKVIEPTNLAFGRDVVWCMPAYANRRAYIRNDAELVCVNLAAP